MVSDYLPIKVVLRDPNRVQQNRGGGGKTKFFGDVEEARSQLLSQIATVGNALEPIFASRPNVPAVARVGLKADAIAKSHRPEALLEPACPVIGAGSAGELFIRVTQGGLDNLARKIESADTKKLRANLTAIDAISAVTVDDRVRAGVATPAGNTPLKVRLFDHGREDINARVRTDYLEHLRGLQATFTDLEYADDMRMIIVRSAIPNRRLDLRAVAGHPGVRSASVVPNYFPLRHLALPVTGPPLTFPMPETGTTYPVVAIVDSGVDPACTPLLPWIEATESYVAPPERDPRHGTFVAGLTAFGELINGPLVTSPGEPCRILDVQVVPGPNGQLTEVDLVAALHEVVPKYADRVKIWNLSLGSDEICSHDAFSDLAHALDELQIKHNIQFVIAAGNYEDMARSWPPQSAVGDRDRICSPADSALGITVGALAHLDGLGSVVRKNEPSPFSRRGPGPAYLVKPEVVHYGGNCDASFGYRGTGVKSINESGTLSEDIGTSFSTPLTSALLANVVHDIHPAPSLNLARALLVHSTDHEHDPKTADIEYFGFGRPTGVARLLHSTAESATLVFEDTLKPGRHYEMAFFPFPACLMDGGKSRGTVKMTLAYTPRLDPNFGMEYCRTNIEAHLGTYHRNKKSGALVWTNRVPLDPKISGAMYEADLVKLGHKWSPVKSYRNTLDGVLTDHWRLRLDLLHRAGEIETPLDFALVITVSGEPGDPVYNDVVTALRLHGIVTQDLPLRSEVRQRLQGNS